MKIIRSFSSRSRICPPLSFLDEDRINHFILFYEMGYVLPLTRKCMVFIAKDHA